MEMANGMTCPATTTYLSHAKQVQVCTPTNSNVITFETIFFFQIRLQFEFPLISVTCAQPPKVENARMFGNKKERYQVNSVIRYQCSENFTQRHLPVIRCMADGQWEKPRVQCIASKLLKHYQKHNHYPTIKKFGVG